MNQEALEILGLTNNEIKVYLFVLEKGHSNGTQIRNNTKIAHSRVYAALDTLIDKGLIIFKKTPKGKIYSALNPEILENLIDDRKNKILEYIPILKNLQKKEKFETDTGVFEGFNGFKSALYNLANECPSNETIYIIGFSNQAYNNKRLADLLQNVNKISIKKKHKFKMILDNSENTFYKQRKEEKISEIKFMENGFKSPAAIDIFQDKVYIFLWDENPYVFTIKNKNIAEGFKIYFNFLWNIAKK